MKQPVYYLSYRLSNIWQISHQMFNVTCPPCCWTTHSSRQRHWPMAQSTKRCDSLPPSVTIVCFSWLTVVLVDFDRLFVECPQTA